MAPNHSDISLDKLLATKQKTMFAELETIRQAVTHGPSMGDVGENKWRSFLQTYLPKRYQIEKAFVVSCSGKISDQVDIVIFDRQYSHFVLNQDGLAYVPAESVYAVFELKQNIDKANLEYTGDKIESVRALARTSVAVPQIDGKLKKKKPARIIGGLIALQSDYSVAFGDPFQKNLRSIKKLKKIDMVFSLKDGFYPASSRENGLLSFMYKLMTELQKMGNPPAIDYQKYYPRT